MNKTELIEHIAKHADISKAAATRALEAVIGGVKTTLKRAVPYLWLDLVRLQLVSALSALVAIHAPVKR